MHFRTINSNIIRKRIFGILIFSCCLYIIYLNRNSTPVVCYFKNNWEDGKTLPNVNNDSNLKFHKNLKNIFFHETSCSADGTIWMNSRQACAVESAAFMNPEHQVYVLFTSQVGFRNSSPLPIIDALLSYANVNLYYLNLTQYAQNTPLNKWMAKGALWTSDYVNSHTSDILRYLSLWKYSGTYLDLDIVMMKPLNTMKPNYAGAESNNFVAAGIINFEGETGHEIADMCVQDLLKNFNGKDWGNNGPGVITRVLQKLCGTTNVMKMIENCKEIFQVLSIETCYSIRWPEHKKFFRPEYLNETMSRLNNSLIAHVWNKHSNRTPLSMDSNVAYIHLARRFCPRVVEVSNYF